MSTLFGKIVNVSSINTKWKRRNRHEKTTVRYFGCRNDVYHGACGSTGGNASGGSEKVNLTVAYADPEDSVFGKGAAAFKEKLEELSGGNMTCTIYPNGTLGQHS